jgi:NADH-quinone oxidoreductase subunit J
MTDALLFYLFAVMALAGAILTITRSNAVHSALSLIASLIGVAGLFLLQRAEFLFAVQILLYVGGVTVLFLFVIMLVNLDEEAKMRQFNGQWWLSLLAVVSTGVLSLWAFRGALALPAGTAIPAAVAAEGNTQRIADVLFSEYLVPFELASLLLIVAVVGAVLMARKREAPQAEGEVD